MPRRDAGGNDGPGGATVTATGGVGATGSAGASGGAGASGSGGASSTGGTVGGTGGSSAGTGGSVGGSAGSVGGGSATAGAGGRGGVAGNGGAAGLAGRGGGAGGAGGQAGATTAPGGRGGVGGAAAGGAAGAGIAGAGGGGTGGAAGAGGAGAGAGGIAGGAGAGAGGIAGGGGAGGAVALATGSCAAPCGLRFAANPASGLPEGAILYVNLTTGVARLRDSASTAAAGETLILQFSFDPVAGSNRGYHISFTGGNLWDEWTEPYEYDTTVGMYSVKQYLPITSEMVETSMNKLVLLTFYLVDHGVVVQSVRLPTCTAGTGSCRTTTNCPVVNAGSAGPVATTCDMTCAGGLSCATQCTATDAGLSTVCADCYARFVACSRTMCPGEFECPTPRQNGNGCMRCQVDKGCARAFMTCSSLDHMPLGTLLLPLPN